MVKHTPAKDIDEDLEREPKDRMTKINSSLSVLRLADDELLGQCTCDEPEDNMHKLLYNEDKASVTYECAKCGFITDTFKGPDVKALRAANTLATILGFHCSGCGGLVYVVPKEV